MVAASIVVSGTTPSPSARAWDESPRWWTTTLVVSGGLVAGLLLVQATLTRGPAPSRRADAAATSGADSAEPGAADPAVGEHAVPAPALDTVLDGEDTPPPAPPVSPPPAPPALAPPTSLAVAAAPPAPPASGAGPPSAPPAALDVPAGSGTARTPGPGGSVRLTPDRVAYLRCTEPCPRDRDLERAVWGIVSGFSGCPTLGASNGGADLRLEIGMGVVAAVRGGPPQRSSTVDVGALASCLSPALVGQATPLRAPLVVSFRVDVSPR